MLISVVFFNFYLIWFIFQKRDFTKKVLVVVNYSFPLPVPPPLPYQKKNPGYFNHSLTLLLSDRDSATYM